MDTVVGFTAIAVMKTLDIYATLHTIVFDFLIGVNAVRMEVYTSHLKMIAPQIVQRTDSSLLKTGYAALTIIRRSLLYS